MSADNWATCPRCGESSEAKRAKLQQAADDAYGKVSKEEWERLEKTARDARFSDDASFREDYEQGLILGYRGIPVSYFVSYSGHCTKCDFGLDYEFQKELNP